MNAYVASGADISGDGRYRYRLWREWRLHPRPAQWDMWSDEIGKPVVDGAGSQLGEPRACIADPAVQEAYFGRKNDADRIKSLR